MLIKPENWFAFLDIEQEFRRARPLNLEVDLGCGKGRFLIARAAKNRDICYLGIDRRQVRLLKIERAARRSKLENIRLLCAEISFAVANLLPDNSVAVYYLFFPDPWPKRRHQCRRLFGSFFLDAVYRTLCAQGKIHVATDHMDYFWKINDIMARDNRFTKVEPFMPAEDERTNFELVFSGQNKAIGRCSFIKK